MRIKKIEVQNFKAVSSQELSLNGCSAIITAGNDSGKTSILRGLIDRFKSEKPEIILKEGKSKGFNNIELTDGSRIEWSFTEKTERFAFITSEGIKQTSGVLSAIGKKYFGEGFNINEFLSLSASKQQEKLFEICGVDTSSIDDEYNQLYGERTELNRELKYLRSLDLKEPEKVDEIDIDAIRDQREKAAAENQKKQFLISVYKENKNDLYHIRKSLAKADQFQKFFDYDAAEKYVESLDPGDIELTDLSQFNREIEQAISQNSKAESYKEDLKRYKKWVAKGKIAKKEVDAINQRMNNLNHAKAELLESAKFPEGFEFNESGLLYNGFPLTDNQVSTSAKYIAGLKIGALTLGSIKTLHFDASPLDKANLMAVQQWADTNDLQLLIERPDYDGGEIRYEIIQP